MRTIENESIADFGKQLLKNERVGRRQKNMCVM